MKKQEEHKHEEGKRYLKKFEIVETDVELPIQSQVRDPEDLYKFLKDLEFDTKMIWHYFSLFLATKFIVLLNHHGSVDPTPDEDDRKLMRAFQADSQILSFKPFFADFIIVAKQSYFSMATNDGTACHFRQ